MEPKQKKSNTKNPNSFFDGVKSWKKEFQILRSIALKSKLVEEIKWGQPCYTWNGQNIFLLHGFKEYVAILFFKGALLKDSKKILIQQTKNVQAARQMRFQSAEEITKSKTTIQAFMRDAIELEKAGKKPILKKTSEFEVPEEFLRVLEQNPKLQTAFQELTPGRQRGYLLFFNAAKRKETREERITKHIPNILNGKGLND
ncbi:MAG: YdeI/OmpD-associated family protein [Leptospira sp.]|uniref:YdeI/OmpD-associated family protein n=1 Tax=Leptospira paudalimensis TaxID=2950024 RepID=A0ABT3MCG2_9LEPT|nr:MULTISPECIES: YdeI/OmpD-associated family protein [Leptospira]MBL0954049.1 YdeI/OmpD-associated family protein [Leptospira sp.]MCW7506078.1 YdeI/OmpD-associated family protein [Leptospira paudalimensis]